MVDCEQGWAYTHLYINFFELGGIPKLARGWKKKKWEKELIQYKNGKNVNNATSKKIYYGKCENRILKQKKRRKLN